MKKSSCPSRRSQRAGAPSRTLGPFELTCNPDHSPMAQSMGCPAWNGPQALAGPSTSPSHDFVQAVLGTWRPRYVTARPDGNYWLEQVRSVAAPMARGSLAADVVVVGGGIAGLSAARHLCALGKDVVLVEAATCGSVATGRRGVKRPWLSLVPTSGGGVPATCRNWILQRLGSPCSRWRVAQPCWSDQRHQCCRVSAMGIGKAVVAGVGAKMLTGSLLGFVVVFALIYWLL